MNSMMVFEWFLNGFFNGFCHSNVRMTVLLKCLVRCCCVLVNANFITSPFACCLTTTENDFSVGRFLPWNEVLQLTTTEKRFWRRQALSASTMRFACDGCRSALIPRNLSTSPSACCLTTTENDFSVGPFLPWKEVLQ